MCIKTQILHKWYWITESALGVHHPYLLMNELSSGFAGLVAPPELLADMNGLDVHGNAKSNYGNLTTKADIAN